MAPIHNAAKNGNLNRVKALLNQGVPMNARNTNGWTPLHEAANAGHLNVVQELLKRGAHVNPRTSSGRTPLHVAALWKHPHVVHALLKAGANPKYRTIYGKNASTYSLNAMRTSRAATKWIKKTRSAANKRRQNAMRQALSLVPVREGSVMRQGLPTNLLNNIAQRMHRRTH